MYICTDKIYGIYNKYPRPAVTAECIVITKEAEPKVLLIERGDELMVVKGLDAAAIERLWIRQSYELVLSKLPKKLREKYL